MAVKNQFAEKFSYRPTQVLATYMQSYVCSTTGFSVDGNANDVESDNTVFAVIAGQPYVATADAAFDISAEPPYAAWAVSTAYTTMGTASEVTVQGRHFACILAHTSSSVATSAGDKPLVGVNWRTYWRELDVWAEDATGDSLGTNGFIGYYLCCMLYDGTLRLFKAYTGAASASTELKIPAFDATRYAPVGILKITSGGTFVVGTTSTAGVSVFSAIVGPILPHYLLADAN